MNEPHIEVQWLHDATGQTNEQVDDWAEEKLTVVDLDRWIIRGSEIEHLSSDDGHDIILHAYLHDRSYDGSTASYRAYFDAHPTDFGGDTEAIVFT